MTEAAATSPIRAADVMVTDVVFAAPDMDVQALARLLVDRRISAVPVIDQADRLVGIVSENDIVRRAEIGTERRHHWLRLLLDPHQAASEFSRANARRVADVMTKAVVTVTPQTPLAEVAALLESHHIKRVPVVDQGKVVGIVSRANLVQAIAAFAGAAGSPADPTNLRERVVARIKAQPWRSWMVNVTADAGRVELWGMVDSPEVKQATRIAAETTPGVLTVVDHLMVAPALSE